MSGRATAHVSVNRLALIWKGHSNLPCGTVDIPWEEELKEAGGAVLPALLSSASTFRRWSLFRLTMLLKISMTMMMPLLAPTQSDSSASTEGDEQVRLGNAPKRLRKSEQTATSRDGEREREEGGNPPIPYVMSLAFSHFRFLQCPLRREDTFILYSLYGRTCKINFMAWLSGTGRHLGRQLAEHGGSRPISERNWRSTMMKALMNLLWTAL